MYGKASVKGDENPRIKMKHLSALVALKIVNQGDGVADKGDSSIEINNVEFVAPEEVVGNFNVTVSQTPIKYDKVAASATAKVNLADANGDGITIKPRDEALVYFAVKPFTAKKDAKITIKINGSPRTVQMPNDIKFEAGKVTTIRVPVKLSYPKASDAVGKQSVGYDFITWENKRETKLYVNGEELKAYIVGENNKVGGLIIRGVVRDLINALDAGFFASTWQGKKAAMTVDNINLWIPEYDNSGNVKKRTNFSEYGPLKEGAATAAYDMLGGGFFGGLAYAAVYVAFPYLIEDGIPREGDMLYLTRFMDPANITFSGVIENGYAEGTTDILILDENPIYKELGTAAVDKLLREKFDYVDASQNTYIPTFEGMYDIVNGISSDAATITAKAIYGKLESAIGTKEVTVSSYKLKLAPVFNAVFPSESEMTRMLGDIEVAIKITTYPFGTETSYNPIIFWGLDAYGPNASSPNL